MQKRNILMDVVLSIISCGIYYIYLVYNQYRTINQEAGCPDTAARDLILSIFTCGIWLVYCSYVYAKRINDFYGVDNSILTTILTLLGCGIVSYCIMQDSLNQYIDRGCRNIHELGD